MKLLDVNPTPIMVEHIDHTLTDAQLQFLRLHDSIGMNGVHVSTDYNILYNDILQDLKDKIEASCNRYFHQVYGASTDVKLKITTSVYAKTQPTQSQGMHKHTNSLIAGCFYITKLQDSPLRVICDEPMFRDFNFCFPYERETKYNQGMIAIDADVGDVVIFPGHYYHYVDNSIQSAREVIGFSAFVYGDFSRSLNTWARYNPDNATQVGYGSRLKI